MSDDGFDEFLKRAQREMFPKMKDSALSVTLLSKHEPDPKLCVELGAAIMFEKPIIIVAEPGTWVPPVLRGIAAAVVLGNMGDPDFADRINAAVAAVVGGK